MIKEGEKEQPRKDEKSDGFELTSLPQLITNFLFERARSKNLRASLCARLSGPLNFFDHRILLPAIRAFRERPTTACRVAKKFTEPLFNDQNYSLADSPAGRDRARTVIAHLSYDQSR